MPARRSICCFFSSLGNASRGKIAHAAAWSRLGMHENTVSRDAAAEIRDKAVSIAAAGSSLAVSKNASGAAFEFGGLAGILQQQQTGGFSE